MPVDSQTAIELLSDIFDRVASDLSMLSDRRIDVNRVDYEERVDRPVGEGTIHIAYRFGIHTENSVEHGALLIPLVPSTALAGYLMMASDSQVEEMMARDTLDAVLKEAMLEIGNFVAAATDGALRSVGATYDRVVFEGCQGVQADVRPRLSYVEGTPLSVGRAEVAVAKLEPAEMILALPHVA